jgi:DNA-binding NtrC family response regulator
MATILLVDDDPLKASVRKSILERKFSDVKRVGDAAEALRLVEQPQFAGSLGLVVSGHQQSGIGAPDFVAEFHSRMPSVPVLVLDDNGRAHDEFPDEGVSFVPRPLVAEQMLALAGELMEPSRQKTA